MACFSALRQARQLCGLLRTTTHAAAAASTAWPDVVTLASPHVSSSRPTRRPRAQGSSPSPTMPSVTPSLAPDLDKHLKSLKGQPLEASVEKLISLLKRRQIHGSEACALATAHILVQVVARSKWQDADGLLDKVAATGSRLVEAQPTELVIANIVRRVLALIRDEAAEDRNEPSSETQSEAQMTPTDAGSLAHNWPTPPPTHSRQDSAGDGPSRPGLLQHSQSFVNVPKSLFHLLSVSSPSDGGAPQAAGASLRTSGTSTPTNKGGAQAYSQVQALRSEVIDGIEEIKDEIGQADDQMAALAEVQIHPGDHVLVYRPSATVERFMLRAALKRKFSVFVASGPAGCAAFGKKLAAAGITAIQVQNAGLMAYMSRVDKVVLGARAVVANGGVVADAGAAAVARAAKEAGCGVVVLAGVYKLSPEAGPGADAESVTEWGDPATSVGSGDGPGMEGIEVRSAVTELVPPELVDTYVTNLGSHSRDQLASLLADHYKPEDADFQLWGAADR